MTVREVLDLVSHFCEVQKGGSFTDYLDVQLFRNVIMSSKSSL